jgi:hypothetical protein
MGYQVRTVIRFVVRDVGPRPAGAGSNVAAKDWARAEKFLIQARHAATGWNKLMPPHTRTLKELCWRNRRYLTHHLDDEIKRAHSEQRRERGEPGGVRVLAFR